MPSAGCPSATALATISSRRAAPSSIENSVWTWRWVNESDMAGGTTLPHDPGESQWCGLRTYPAREKRVQILGVTSRRVRGPRRVRDTCRDDPAGAEPGRLDASAAASPPAAT